MTIINDMTDVGSGLAEVDEAIEGLEALVNSATTSVTQDGQTVSFDQELGRKRLRELEKTKSGINDEIQKRPRCTLINLS